MAFSAETAVLWRNRLDVVLERPERLTAGQKSFLDGIKSGLQSKGGAHFITSRQMADLKYLARHAMDEGPAAPP